MSTPLTYDFTDLDNEVIKHPSSESLKPNDGDLFFIRTQIKDKKIKRLQKLLEPEILNLEFIDVEGVAVTLNKAQNDLTIAGYCLAWDHRGGRMFPADSALRNGTYVSYEQFMKLYNSCLSSQIGKSWT